jgi:hypothetical protein
MTTISQKLCTSRNVHVNVYVVRHAEYLKEPRLRWARRQIFAKHVNFGNGTVLQLDQNHVKLKNFIFGFQFNSKCEVSCLLYKKKKDRSMMSKN